MLIALVMVSCKKDRPDLTLQGKWISNGYSKAYFDSNNHQITPYIPESDVQIKLIFDGDNVSILDSYNNATITIPFTSNKYGKDINLSLGGKGIYLVNNWNVVKEEDGSLSLTGDITHAMSPLYYVNGNKIEVDHVLIKLDLKRIN
ncbi:hypothetical protein [Pedobacter agri]|uniref:Uncharacterized protein n=1 Tax=Pedobacter agri TaxID=454586 RepID=A0A9X3I9F8_9SPHI|nr:hypothetical protein [Pedobacter agri]MCX3264508.1 hypothetical protein [Pedobacter agri]